MASGTTKIFYDTVFGYPYPSLSDIPLGEYYVQALLYFYETFELFTGQTVKLPIDSVVGQQWNFSPRKSLRYAL